MESTASPGCSMRANRLTAACGRPRGAGVVRNPVARAYGQRKTISGERSPRSPRTGPARQVLCVASSAAHRPREAGLMAWPVARRMRPPLRAGAGCRGGIPASYGFQRSAVLARLMGWRVRWRVAGAEASRGGCSGVAGGVANRGPRGGSYAWRVAWHIGAPPAPVRWGQGACSHLYGFTGSGCLDDLGLLLGQLHPVRRWVRGAVADHRLQGAVVVEGEAELVAQVGGRPLEGL